jgi:hypothetical protein
VDYDKNYSYLCLQKSKDMKISIFVPQHGTIEGITPAYRTFNTANELLTAIGKKKHIQRRVCRVE